MHSETQHSSSRGLSTARYSVLGASDELWRSLWRRYGRVDSIAASLALHYDDVRVRLRAAGVTLRGRPRMSVAPPEVPTHRANTAPHGTQLLVPGLCILG